jgi:hypothetical protein
VIKVVETPPGPPVLATLLAEVYGPDEATRQKTALVLEQIFKSVPFIVDTDNSFGLPRPTLRLVPDRTSSTTMAWRRAGARQYRRADGRQTLAYAPRGPSAIRCRSRSAWIRRSASGAARWRPRRSRPRPRPIAQPGRTGGGAQRAGGQAIFRRDGRGATMVMADMAGAMKRRSMG